MASDTKELDFNLLSHLWLVVLDCVSPEVVFIFIYLFFGCTAPPMGSQFPAQEWNPCPLQWKQGVLTTGPVGRPSVVLLKVFCSPHFVCLFSKGPISINAINYYI